jgi:hypothetical protein
LSPALRDLAKRETPCATQEWPMTIKRSLPKVHLIVIVAVLLLAVGVSAYAQPVSGNTSHTLVVKPDVLRSRARSERIDEMLASTTGGEQPWPDDFDLSVFVR